MDNFDWITKYKFMYCREKNQEQIYNVNLAYGYDQFIFNDGSGV